MPQPFVHMCRRVKMTRLRARVAERLKGAQNTFAMLTTFNEVDMTQLMALRSEFKARSSAACLCVLRSSQLWRLPGIMLLLSGQADLSSGSSP